MVVVSALASAESFVFDDQPGRCRWPVVSGRGARFSNSPGNSASRDDAAQGARYVGDGAGSAWYERVAAKIAR